MYTVASATPSCAAWRRRHHVSDGFMCGIASATSATASCAASCQRHQRRLPMRHDVSDISDGFMCGASRSCRASRPLWSRPRQRLFGPSHRAARATCRRSRSVLPCGRECCPRRVFAPCTLLFDVARRAPCRGPARRLPRPPCCSPALFSLCTFTEQGWIGESPRGCCFSGRSSLLFLPPGISREKDTWCASMGGGPVRVAAWRFQLRGAAPARGFIPHGP